jgi:hypothetical protein
MKQETVSVETMIFGLFLKIRIVKIMNGRKNII